MFGKSFYNGNFNYFSISALGSAAISDIKYKFGTSSLKCSGGFFRTSESRMTVLGRSRFTIDFWLNPDSTLSAKSYIFDSRGRQFSSDTAIESLAIHGTDDGKIVFKWGDNSPILSSTIAISVNTWTHIAIECNSLNIVSAYINGNLIGNSTVTASIGSESRNIFTLGGSSLAPNGTGVYLGHIDEFRFMLHTAAYSQTSFLPPTSSYYNRGLPGKI